MKDKEMLIKECEKEIEKLKTRLFYLDMCDRWNEDDYKLHDEMMKLLKELEQKLEALKNE